MPNRHGATNGIYVAPFSGKDRDSEEPSRSANQGSAGGGEPARTDQVAPVEAASSEQCRSVEDGITEIAATEGSEGEPRTTEIAADERDTLENGVGEISAAEIDAIEAGVSQRQGLKGSLLFEGEQPLSHRFGAPLPGS